MHYQSSFSEVKAIVVTQIFKNKLTFVQCVLSLFCVFLFGLLSKKQNRNLLTLTHFYRDGRFTASQPYFFVLGTLLALRKRLSRDCKSLPIHFPDVFI